MSEYDTLVINVINNMAFTSVRMPKQHCCTVADVSVFTGQAVLPRSSSSTRWSCVGSSLPPLSTLSRSSPPPLPSPARPPSPWFRWLKAVELETGLTIEEFMGRTPFTFRTNMQVWNYSMFDRSCFEPLDRPLSAAASPAQRRNSAQWRIYSTMDWIPLE